jgi:hypothetical protein
MTREAEHFAARQQESLRQGQARRERAGEFASALGFQFGDANTSLLAVIGFGSTFEVYGGDAVRQLFAEPKQDYDFIVQNGQKNAVMSERIAVAGTGDEYAYAALGYTLHNLYNAFEGYFFRIAKLFENNVSDLT